MNKSELGGKINKLRGQLEQTQDAFMIWEAIQEMNSPSHVGEERGKGNVRLMNDWSPFFIALNQSTSFFMVMTLWRFFDTDGDVLSLHHLKGEVKENLEELGLDEIFFGKLQIARGHSELIERLDQARHRLGHNLLNPKKEPLSVGDFQELFKICFDFLNKLSMEIFGNGPFCFSEMGKNQTKEIVELLIKEDQRMREELQKRVES